MYINDLKGDGFFDKNEQQYVLDYLTSSGISDLEYKDFICNFGYGFLNDNILIIDGEEYCLECFLGKSDNTAYDIVSCNKVYGLDDTPVRAIAVLYGDDTICINSLDGRIYFWNGDDLIKVAENFGEFIKKIQLVQDN